MTLDIFDAGLLRDTLQFVESVPGAIVPDKHLRIFISSPSDVAEERIIARNVIKNKLSANPLVREHVTFDPVTWDDPDAQTPMPANLPPQEAINRGLRRPSQCDIVVVILWSRMGTPLQKDRYRKPNGDAYLSGTEWEFEDAWQSTLKTGTPTVLVYRRKATPQIPIDLGQIELEELRTQWSRVEAFCGHIAAPHGPQTGSIHAYGTPAEFEEILTQHLLMLVNQAIRSAPTDKTNSDVLDAALIKYRTETKSRFSSLPWTHNSFKIAATRPSKERVDARAYIKDWVQAPGPRCLVLVGEFGSGKTGLLRWLASEIASEQSSHCPFFISLADVRRQVPRSVADLAALADPKLPESVSGFAIEKFVPIVLLDGLDEVVDPQDRNLSQHRPVLQGLGRIIPPDARLIITCRTLFYESVAADVAALQGGREVDRTEAAISAALEGGFDKPEVLALCDVAIEEGERYLSTGTAGNVWPTARGQLDLSEFMRSPFTLRMLERALPSLLAQSGLVDLDKLYDVAIKAMLLKDKKARPTVSKRHLLNTNALRNKTNSRTVPPYRLGSHADCCARYLDRTFVFSIDRSPNFFIHAHYSESWQNSKLTISPALISFRGSIFAVSYCRCCGAVL